MLPRWIIPLCGLLCWPGSAFATTPIESLSCRVESALNESTGERLSPPGDTPFHALADLIPAGDYLTHHQTTESAHLDVDTTYRIDRTTLRFEAFSVQTRHDLGEEHAIREKGQCEPATG